MAKFCQIFRSFWGQWSFEKNAFDIYWPLARYMVIPKLMIVVHCTKVLLTKPRLMTLFLLPKTDDNLQKRIVGQWRLCLHCLSSEMYSVKLSRIGYARCGGVGNVFHLRVFLHSTLYGTYLLHNKSFLEFSYWAVKSNKSK